MYVRDIMNLDPPVVTPRDRLDEAAAIMRDHGVGAVPVVDRRDAMRLLGLVTARGITVWHVAEGHDGACPVAEALSTAPLTVHPDDRVEDLLHVLHEDAVQQVPVVEDGCLVGVVSHSDLLVGLFFPDGQSRGLELAHEAGAEADPQ